MEGPETTGNPEEFEQKSQTFISWFEASEGARLSSNIKLADLRSQHAGRGAGMSLYYWVDPQMLSISSSRSGGHG